MEGQGWFNSDADGMQNLVEGTLHRTKFDLVIKWPHNNSVLPPAFEVTVGIDIDTSEEAVRARVALAPPSRRERWCCPSECSDREVQDQHVVHSNLQSRRCGASPELCFCPGPALSPERRPSRCLRVQHCPMVHPSLKLLFVVAGECVLQVELVHKSGQVDAASLPTVTNVGSEALLPTHASAAGSQGSQESQEPRAATDHLTSLDPGTTECDGKLLCAVLEGAW